MHTRYLKEMVRALRPALMDAAKAHVILERFWADRKAVVWEIKDVHRAANERDLVLTNAEARQILQKLMDGYDRYDAERGINWLKLIDVIDDTCPGRKITRHELKRFLEKDVIATETGRKTHARKARHTGHR